MYVWGGASSRCVRAFTAVSLCRRRGASTGRRCWSCLALRSGARLCPVSTSSSPTPSITFLTCSPTCPASATKASSTSAPSLRCVDSLSRLLLGCVYSPRRLSRGRNNSNISGSQQDHLVVVQMYVVVTWPRFKQNNMTKIKFEKYS